MSVFVQISCCFDSHSFIVLSEAWDGYAPCFVVVYFFQDYFGNSGSFMVPCEF